MNNFCSSNFVLKKTFKSDRWKLRAPPTITILIALPGVDVEKNKRYKNEQMINVLKRDYITFANQRFEYKLSIQDRIIFEAVKISYLHFLCASIDSRRIEKNVFLSGKF